MVTLLHLLHLPPLCLYCSASPLPSKESHRPQSLPRRLPKIPASSIISRCRNLKRRRLPPSLLPLTSSTDESYVDHHHLRNPRDCTILNIDASFSAIHLYVFDRQALQKPLALPLITAVVTTIQTHHHRRSTTSTLLFSLNLRNFDFSCFCHPITMASGSIRHVFSPPSTPVTTTPLPEYHISNSNLVRLFGDESSIE